MSSQFVRDRSLHSVKDTYDQLKNSQQETPTGGQWNVTRTFRPPDTVRFYGAWLKRACKLLDIGYLRQYWGILGHYLGVLSKRVAEFKEDKKRLKKKGIKASP